MSTTSTLELNCFESFAQQVWAATSIDEKRQLMTKIINGFKFKAKQEQFRRKIASAKNAFTLDKLAGDLVLIETGDRVIK